MKLKFFIGISVIIIFAILDLLLGPRTIDFDDRLFVDILINFRLPKVIVAVLVGIALSCSGLVMQTVFRNPLAGPYMLGVSSGASLGVAILMMSTSMVSFVGENFRVLGMASSAWIGALIVLAIIMFVSNHLKDIMSILIIGMMIGSASSAFIDILQVFSSEAALKGFVLWSMGSIGGLSWEEIMVMTGCVFVGLLVIVSILKTLDVLLLGDNYAMTLGIDIKKSRMLIFIATALLAGGVTAFCGPISFVGLISPHIARMIWHHAPHRILMPSSIIVGVTIMLICDILSSLPVLEYTFPINTITSLFGIPVVIMIVWRGNKVNRIM